MPGYQEILIISVIVLGVLLIPRAMEQKRPAPRLVRPKKRLSGRWRLAIAVSIVYPMATAAILQPWRQNLISYLYFGIGPVLLGWLLYWVLLGFNRR